MNQQASPILSSLTVLSDALRSRLLLVLDGQTLSVSELCDVLQLPQSTVSRHLKTLVDGRWAQVRREGTSRLYSMAVEELDPSMAELWQVVKGQVATLPAALQDRTRLARVLASRRSVSADFFSRAAGQWDALRNDLYGESFHLGAFLAAWEPSWAVADLGCGTGRSAQAIAPFVNRVLAVDASSEMLAAAGERLVDVPNVELRPGALEAVPIDDASVDVALLVLVLHHLADPAVVLREARRILRPGGRALVVDMQPHDREEYRAQMGHVWLGFSPLQVGRLFWGAGFDAPRIVALPPAPGVRGPSLFVARGVPR